MCVDFRLNCKRITIANALEKVRTGLAALFHVHQLREKEKSPAHLKSQPPANGV